MDAAIYSLAGTIAVAGIGTFLNERYKRHLDAASAAAALAGELASYLSAFKSFDVSLNVLVSQAEAGVLRIPEQGQMMDTAYDAYVDKIGLLGPRLAEDVAAVYGAIRGFRAALSPVTKPDRRADAAYDVASLRVAHMFAQGARAKAVSLVELLRLRARSSFWRYLFSPNGRDRAKPPL